MNQQVLINRIKRLRQDKRLSKIINDRLAEFEKFKEHPKEKWFSELCFCLLTANYTAHGGLRIQEFMEKTNGFIEQNLEELKYTLVKLSHRFPNKRAEFIIKAREFLDIKEILRDFKDDFEKREFLVENILGLGYKEASHFLRNTGHKNLAILDRHIINILHEHKLIEEAPKSLQKNKYLEIEKIMEELCKEAQMTQAELDLYLWYTKTGEVLK